MEYDRSYVGFSLFWTYLCSYVILLQIFSFIFNIYFVPSLLSILLIQHIVKCSMGWSFWKFKKCWIFLNLTFCNYCTFVSLLICKPGCRTNAYYIWYQKCKHFFFQFISRPFQLTIQHFTICSLVYTGWIFYFSVCEINV